MFGDSRSTAGASLGIFSSPVILSLLSVIFPFTVRFLHERILMKRTHDASSGTREQRSYRRRTSHMSAMCANRQLLEKGLAVKQNVINIIFYFERSNFSEENNENESGDSMRLDFVQTMTALATKYERMRSIPRFDVDERHGECVWCPIDDIPRLVGECVSVDPMYVARGEDDSNEKLVLQRAHKYVSEILAAQDKSGQDIPLWRVIILSSKFALFRIDHCIGDGLSAATMLRDVGVKTTSKEPLILEDLSPILKYFVRAGDLRIR